jgi:hypothetical protein
VFAVVCFMDPNRPAVKALFNLVKRCLTGAPLICPTTTRLTYPLKTWDSCDCPVNTTYWDDGLNVLAMTSDIYSVGASSNCVARIATTFAPCLNDLGQQDGCCSEACWRKMNTLGSRECVKQYMASVCSLPDQQHWARAFENLSKRCIESSAFHPTCQNVVEANQSLALANTSLAGSARSSARLALPLPCSLLLAAGLLSVILWTAM